MCRAHRLLPAEMPFHNSLMGEPAYASSETNTPCFVIRKTAWLATPVRRTESDRTLTGMEAAEGFARQITV